VVSSIKKNSVLILIVIVLIASSILNIYQYKSCLAIKEYCGGDIRQFGLFALGNLPENVLEEISNDDIDEIGLVKVIEQIKVTEHFQYSIRPVNKFLDNTKTDLKKLYKLIKESGNEGEINALIKEIADNQKKSLKIYEEIKKFEEEYKSQMNNEDRADDKWDLLWYRNRNSYSNSQWDSDELIKIIEDGFR
jgi:hypothetical protein